MYQGNLQICIGMPWEKKLVSVEKFWEAPWTTETKHVLVKPKGFTKTLLFINSAGVVYFYAI
jgi:hypothetical protein